MEEEQGDEMEEEQGDRMEEEQGNGMEEEVEVRIERIGREKGKQKEEKRGKGRERRGEESGRGLCMLAYIPRLVAKRHAVHKVKGAKIILACLQVQILHGLMTAPLAMYRQHQRVRARGGLDAVG